MENKSKSKGKILGVDFGTTNSVITVYDTETGEYTPIPSLDNEPIVPSAIHIREGKIIVGSRAREELKYHPENTILSIKSFMDNPRKKIMIKNASTDGIDIEFNPIRISSKIFMYIKKSAEDYLQEEIKDVVITVPAYFREVERQATARAAERAGLNAIEIINEPTAACLAYGYSNTASDEEKRILVYDLGGGTFDVTLLDMSPDFYEVIATDGDKIGGDDIDLEFLEYLKRRVDIGESTTNQAKLIVEEAKKQLTYKDEVEVDFSEYGGSSVRVTRNQLERAVGDVIKSTLVRIEGLLAQYSAPVDEVVLVGGSTKMPYIKREIVKLLNLKKDYFDKYDSLDLDPDLAVSKGACIRGRILLGETDIIFMDITPFDLGIELDDGKMDALIHRGSIIPTIGSNTYNNIPGVSNIKFKIHQGNQILASKNQYLGEINFELDLSFIEVVNFKVEFDLDASGLLTVSVVNLLTTERKELAVTGVYE